MAEAETVGTIRILTDLDDRGIEKELGRLKNKILKLEELLSTSQYKKSSMEKQLEAVQRQAEQAHNSMDIAAERDAAKEAKFLEAEISKIEKTHEKITRELEAEYAYYRDIQQVSENIAESTERITESNAEAPQSIQELNRELREEKAHLKELNEAGINDYSVAWQEENGITDEQVEDYRAATERVAELRDAIRQVRQEQRELKRESRRKWALEVWNAATDALKEEFSRTKSVVRGLASAVSGFTSRMISGISLANKRLNIFNRLAAAIGPTFRRIINLAKRVFFFSMITSGLRVIRTEIGKYLSVNQELQTSLGQLKSVFLTAFQPVYEYALPALNMFVRSAAQAVAVMAELIAGVFGTTAKQAQENAKNLKEEADALDQTGNAAKNAEGSLASFDKINILKEPDAKAGEPLFDYDFDDTSFRSWGEAFDAFLDHILNGGIPKLKRGLFDFADNLNGFSQKLYDMFTFPNVRDKVERIGTELSDALNQMVERINWNLYGAALGAGFNLMLAFLTNALYGFNWRSLGGSFAQLVNGLSAEIDWRNMGMLLWSGFKISLEMLAGFILGADMPLLGNAASQLILGFFTAMIDTIRSIPWDQIGFQIAVFLNNIDWLELLTTAALALGLGVNAWFAILYNFFVTLEWGSIGTAVGEAFTTAFQTIDWALIGQTFSAGILGILEFLLQAVRTTDWKAVGDAIGDFLNNIDWLGILNALGELIYAIFTDVLGGLMSSDGGRMFLALLAAITGLRIAFRIARPAIAAAIGNFTDGIAVKLLSAVPAISTAALLVADAVLLMYDIHTLKKTADEYHEAQETHNRETEIALENFTKLYHEKGPEAAAAWAEMCYEIDVTGKSLDEAQQLLVEKIDSYWEDVPQNLWTGFTQGWDHYFGKGGAGLKALLVDAFNSAVDGVRKALKINSPSKVMLEIGAYMMLGLLNGVQEKVRSVIAVFTGLRDNIQGVFSHISDWFKNTFSRAWEAVKNVFSRGGRVFDGIKDGILQSLKTIINTLISGINRVISIPFQGLNTALSRIRGIDIMGIQPFSFISTIDIPQIPKLARGAVIPPNREFLAVLGDQNSGNNIEAPEALLRQITQEGNTEIVKVLTKMLAVLQAGQTIAVDGVVLGRSVQRELNNITHASGKFALDF